MIERRIPISQRVTAQDLVDILPPASDTQNMKEDTLTAPTIVPGKTRIGWIGTGVMGQSMCGHLIDKGFSATVYSRTKAKAQGLIDKGATWAASPRAVAEQSDVIVAIVGFPKDVREVFLGSDGAFSRLQGRKRTGRHDHQ